MLTAVVLSGDGKLAQQIELWVRQTMPEKLKVESFRSLDSYKELLGIVPDAQKVAAGAGAVAKAPPPRPAPAAGAEAEPRKIRVFIIDVDLIHAKPVQWVTELQRLTKENAPEFIEGGTPRVFMMAYDNGVLKIDSFQNDAIDDLILKPVDKALFLQKLEFVTSDDGKVNPNFLFRAKTAQIVEVGRDVVIDEISEFAVAVRSPGPIPEGAFASVHCDTFGTKGGRRLIGRVYESTKHPVREGEFIVRFSYFGITPEQLSTIRRFIKAHQTPVRPARSWGSPSQSATSNGSSAAAAAAAQAQTGAKPGLSKELMEKMAMLKMRKFAIIDLNPDTLTEAKSLLETAFKGIIVRSYPSYTRFAADLRKLIPETPKPVAPAPPPGAAGAAKPAAKPDRHAPPPEPPFPTGKKLTVILRGKSQDLVRFEPALKKTDTVLGKPGHEWVENPANWAATIEKEDKESFDEFMGFIEGGTIGRTSFRMTDAHGRKIFIEAVGKLEKSGSADGSSLIRVDMKELDQEGWDQAIIASYGPTGAAPKDANHFKFEAILIDSAMLRPDPATWYERFVSLLRNAKVIQGEEAPPKIFVMTDPRANTRLDDYRIKGINDFFFKPLDRRFTIQKYQAFCSSLVPVREPDAPPFVPCELQAKLGREVVMDELAEYGLSIIHPSAFREKSYMRFFSRLFGEEGEWVSGRSHSCEKANSEPGQPESYRCQFMFFGPSDVLLQRIRRWIREDHVAKKEGKG